MTQLNRLTKIEILDHDYPGLADQLREWFLQGVAVRKIPQLVFEKYQLQISDAPVARFRHRRWVREQNLALHKRIERLVQQESASERRRRIFADPSRRGRKVARNG